MKLTVFSYEFCIHLFGLFKITKAAITPGIQPKKVRIVTMRMEPQPLSKTANGGNKIDKITLPTLIYSNSTIKLYFCGFSINSLRGTSMVIVFPSKLKVAFSNEEDLTFLGKWYSILY